MERTWKERMRASERERESKREKERETEVEGRIGWGTGSHTS